MTVRLEYGDCLKIIPKLIKEGVVVDSVITDPPYHLTSTVSRFGKDGSAPPKEGSHYKRLVKGFMGKEWDGGNIAFRPETWEIISQIMRPGAFLVVFGGTRTFHRVVCAIEDAGFIIQDCILWLYGTGFPKRKDAFKPAWEPITVAYKPGGKRTLQADANRIGVKGGMGKIVKQLDWGTRKFEVDDTVRGRWPANVCHDGSEEVMDEFKKYGEKGGGSGKPNKTIGIGIGTGQPRFGNREVFTEAYADSGTISRFFYCAKADAQDRIGSTHPTVKPFQLLKWLVPLFTEKQGLVLDPFVGTGTTGVAALATNRNAIIIEREEEYQDDIVNRMKHLRGLLYSCKELDNGLLFK